MHALKKPLLTARQTGLLLIIYYTVGLVGLSIPASRALFIRLMPFTLMMSMAVLLLYHRRWRLRDVLLMGGIAVAGFLIEVLGVATGLVFGSYSYGPPLGMALAGTPLLIGLNWIMLVYCVYAMLEKRPWPAWMKILAGSALMVAYDAVLEPAAIYLGMWSWAGAEAPFWGLGGVQVPLQNYAAWFVISAIFLLSMHQTRFVAGNRLAPWLFFVQAGFFACLGLIWYIL